MSTILEAIYWRWTRPVETPSWPCHKCNALGRIQTGCEQLPWPWMDLHTFKLVSRLHGSNNHHRQQQIWHHADRESTQPVPLHPAYILSPTWSSNWLSFWYDSTYLETVFQSQWCTGEVTQKNSLSLYLPKLQKTLTATFDAPRHNLKLQKMQNWSKIIVGYSSTSLTIPMIQNHW